MNVYSLMNRILFGVALLLFAVAIVEKIVNFSGYTVVGKNYTPGRLIEFAAMMLLFVLTLLVRDIRDRMRKE